MSRCVVYQSGGFTNYGISYRKYSQEELAEMGNRAMTENEAKAVRFIENIKNHAMVTLDHIVKEEPNVSPLVYKGREEKANTILAMVEEVQQYREIGTPEECQAAMEKQTAKKAITYRGTNRADCPACGATVRGIDAPFGNWCSKCGQRLDWEDEE